MDVVYNYIRTLGQITHVPYSQRQIQMNSERKVKMWIRCAFDDHMQGCLRGVSGEDGTQ